MFVIKCISDELTIYIFEKIFSYLKVVYISGEYGTAIMTYFKFLKWLLKLNFYTMIITFCVITIPYLALGPSTYTDTVQHLNDSATSISCTEEYIEYMNNFTSKESIDEKVIDFLQGTVSNCIVSLYITSKESLDDRFPPKNTKMICTKYT